LLLRLQIYVFFKMPKHFFQKEEKNIRARWQQKPYRATKVFLLLNAVKNKGILF